VKRKCLMNYFYPCKYGRKNVCFLCIISKRNFKKKLANFLPPSLYTFSLSLFKGKIKFRES
jgi:hypothetical protein